MRVLAILLRVHNGGLDAGGDRLDPQVADQEVGPRLGQTTFQRPQVDEHPAQPRAHDDFEVAPGHRVHVLLGGLAREGDHQDLSGAAQQ